MRNWHLVCNRREPRCWLHAIKTGLTLCGEMAPPLVRVCNCTNCAASSIWRVSLRWKPFAKCINKVNNSIQNETLLIRISPAIHSFKGNEWRACRAGREQDWEALSLKLSLKEQSRNFAGLNSEHVKLCSVFSLLLRREGYQRLCGERCRTLP